MPNLITLAELDTLTNQPLTLSYPDEYLNPIIEAISGQVINYCETVVVRQTFDDVDCKYWFDRANVIVALPHRPLVSLSGMVWTQPLSTDRVSIDISKGRIDQATQYVYFSPIVAFNGLTATPDAAGTHLLATYLAGLDPVPAAVKRATALLVYEQALYDDDVSSGRLGDLQSFRNLGYSETYFPGSQSAGKAIGLGTKLATAALNLLAQYRGPAVSVVGL